MKSWLVFLVLAVASPRAWADVDLPAAMLHACDAPAPPPAIAALRSERATALEEQSAARQDALKKTNAPPQDQRNAKQRVTTADESLSTIERALAGATKLFGDACQPGARTTLQTLVGHSYPRAYLTRQLGVDVCSLFLPQGFAQDTTELQAVSALCTSGSEERGGLFNPAGIALDIVQGLGDLLELEAKQEVTQYLIEQIGLKVCNYSFSLPIPHSNPPSKATIRLEAWFPKSCALIRKDDPTTFTYGDLKKAFTEDLHGLPTQLAALANAVFAALSPGEQAWLAIAAVVGDVVFSAAQHKTPLEILQELGEQADAHTGGIQCDFAALTSANRKECVALLLFQLGRTAASEYRGSGQPSLTQVISDALDAFCKVHGTAKPNGECVVSAADYTVWHQRMLVFYRAIKQFLELHDNVMRLTTTASDSEIATRSGGDLAKALRQLIRSFCEILENLPELKSDTTLATELGFLSDGVDVYAAIVENDPVAFRQAVLVVLKSKLLEKAISADAAHAVTVIVSLATAKDRSEAQGILQEVADPVGTYKAKFGADHVMIALNGNVGAMLAEQVRFNVPSASGSKDTTGKLAPFRIGAPVGLDVTLRSWTQWHIGFTVTAIDPLALAVHDTGGSISADWLSLFDFGAYFRVGIARSPFTVMLGAHLQPWNRSEDACGSARCFDGTLSLGAFFTADVPLHMFR